MVSKKLENKTAKQASFDQNPVISTYTYNVSISIYLVQNQVGLQSQKTNEQDN